MALTAFCTSCQRNVYVEEDDTPICPVCSSPLVQTQDDPAPDPEAAGDNTGGEEDRQAAV
jgi:predicted amidophosphoribosyltransferase